MDFEKYQNRVPLTRETREEYRRVDKEMDRLFRSDLEDECGVPHDAPYAAALWSKAYADGHSCGFSCIYSEYVDLVEFVETVLKSAR